MRVNVLGETNVQPTPAQLDQMRGLVREAMEEGAFGLTTALLYAPNSFAKTPELIAMAKESAQCGGIYIAHIRNESDRLVEAIDETAEIAKASGAPAVTYHFKAAGRDNWGRIDAAISAVEAYRRIFAKPHQLAAGVDHVVINGRLALKDGAPTGSPTGRFVHGRAWTGAPGGDCRAAASDWTIAR